MSRSAVLNVLVLSLDWQLASRSSLWEAAKAERWAGCSPGELAGFQQDLHSLRRLAEVVPWLQNRLCLHEATMRLMAGAAPAKTQQLLDRSCSRDMKRSKGLVCGKDKGLYCGEREHAEALVLACKHLPAGLLATPGERAGMLTEAARMLERLGDRRKLAEVNRLIKQISYSCSPA